MAEALRKLRYTGQSAVLVIDAPQEVGWLLSALAEQGAHVDAEARGAYGFVLAFAASMSAAEQLAEPAAQSLEGDGLLWVCYPKGSSKRYPKPDLNRDSLWSLLETHGMRPVAQVAIDEDWSAIRYRRSEYVTATPTPRR